MFNEVRSYSKSEQVKGNRKAPKQVDRNKFTKPVRDQVKEHFNNTCQMCGKKGHHIHHVQPKGSGKGRGVFTNALLLCNGCHRNVHDDDALLRYWKEEYRKKYGPLYFMDEEDLRLKQLTDSLNREVRGEDEVLHS